MKVVDKIVIGAVGVAVVTNPASGQFVLEGLEWGFGVIFKYASPLNFLALGVIGAYIGFRMWDSREKVTIPEKSKKTVSQKYLKTIS